MDMKPRRLRPVIVAELRLFAVGILLLTCAVRASENQDWPTFAETIIAARRRRWCCHCPSPKSGSTAPNMLRHLRGPRLLVLTTGTTSRIFTRA